MSKSLLQQFKTADEILAGAQNILIVSHENPDFDAVGSVLALYHALRYEGKNPLPCLQESPSRQFNFLPGFHSIKNDVCPNDFDVVVCLDYGDFKRLNLPDSFDEEKLITFDHHLMSDQRGKVKIVAPEFSSTSEIIYCWMENRGVAIDKVIATCLLSGIISDTGGFSHTTTSPETLKIVSKLLLKGAPFTKIIRSSTISDGQFKNAKIWGRALSRIKTDKKTSMAYSWVCSRDLTECEASPDDLAGISSVISTISKADLALFLTESNFGKIDGSLRSEPFKGRNVAILAKALGGGGHPYAAGFSQEGSVEEVLKKVLDLIK